MSHFVRLRIGPVEVVAHLGQSGHNCVTGNHVAHNQHNLQPLSHEHIVRGRSIGEEEPSCPGRPGTLQFNSDALGEHMSWTKNV